MMTDFESAYVIWSNAPFPSTSERDDLNDLHGDLALLDEWILAKAYPFAEHGTVTPSRVDIAAGLQKLRDRLVATRKSLAGDDALLVDAYLTYLGILEAVYAEFLKMAAER